MATGGKIKGFKSAKDRRAFTAKVVGAGLVFAALLISSFALMFVTSIGQAARHPGGNGAPADFPSTFFAATVFLWALMLLAPVLLLALFQSWVDRHRLVQGSQAGKKVRYASLWRRALARVADGVFAVIPFCVVLILGAFVVYLTAAWHAAAQSPSKALLLVFSCMASALLAFAGAILLLVFWEGKTGRTPGRKLFHIRLVGSNLKPCGFKRAFVRSLLTVVDSFWFWSIGLYVIAFSPRYQRLGDMVADTVVLKE